MLACAVGGTRVINSLPHQSVGIMILVHVVVYVASIVSTPAQDYFFLRLGN